jgi:CheY-like chemotaxis protein
MRIVYAEDDPFVRETITTFLVEQGVAVHEAHDGGEALMLCRAFQPDAVLLDLGMPNMDGLETARRIRESEMQFVPRIVALTAYGDEDHRRDAEQAGFDAFLCKPTSVTDIVRALRLCN